MPEMPTASRAPDLCPDHTMAPVDLRLHCLRLYRLPKAGPSRSRIELLLRGEQLVSATGADIGSLVVVVPIVVTERELRSLLPQDAILVRRQYLAPFVIALLYGIGQMNHLIPPSVPQVLMACALFSPYPQALPRTATSDQVVYTLCTIIASAYGGKWQGCR
jgi:hypothetical protein